MKLFGFFNSSSVKSEGEINRLAYFFAALGDPTTLRILKVLAKREKLCVSDVARELSASISAISHQMAKLKKLGIVKTERNGKMICYYLLNTPDISVIEKEFLKNAV